MTEEFDSSIHGGFDLGRDLECFKEFKVDKAKPGLIYKATSKIHEHLPTGLIIQPYTNTERANTGARRLSVGPIRLVPEEDDNKDALQKSSSEVCFTQQNESTHEFSHMGMGIAANNRSQLSQDTQLSPTKSRLLNQHHSQHLITSRSSAALPAVSGPSQTGSRRTQTSGTKLGRRN